MPIRNPFKKVQSQAHGYDTTSSRDESGQSKGDSGFQVANLESLKQTSAIGIRPGRDDEPDEFQMSVVNDSGVYLPPSPPEKKGFWHRSHSAASSNHRSCLNENEPFSISRESFDSYRRSFDISARSPIILPETPPRQSLDSRTTRTPRSIRSDRRNDVAFAEQEEEEDFEEVGLADEVKPQKKRGLFSRFGDSESTGGTTSHLGFHITGRKRGHSGQGAELGKLDKADIPSGSQSAAAISRS